jgi:hypothetical protein
MKSLAIAALAASVLDAQQPNTPTASLICNGVNGPPFPIVVTVQSNAPVSGLIQGRPNMPFVLARSISGLLQLGAATYFGDSLDLPVSPFPEIVANGLLPASPFHTDANGNASVLGASPQSAVGSVTAFQAAVGDPFSPYGWSLTSAVALTLLQTWTSTTINPGDEGVVPIALAPLSIPFYGTSHTAIHVSANGYLTFGVAQSDFTPSPTELANGRPRIAGLWCDLECPTGSVTVTKNPPSPATGPGFVRVSYTNVHDWGGFGGPHTFAIQIFDNGLIQVIHSQNAIGSIYDQIVGISPGNGIDASPQKNLSAISQGGSYYGDIGEQLYEWFGIVTLNPYYTNGFDNPYDLYGKVLTFFPAGPGGSTSRYLSY